MSTGLDESSTLALGEINKYDFRTDSPAVFKARRGLDAEIVSQISEMKREPAWMRDFRLKSLEIFHSKPMPRWGGDVAINFQDIFYYLKPAEQQGLTPELLATGWGPETHLDETDPNFQTRTIT